MTKDQALDWLAWGIVGIAAGGLVIQVLIHAEPRVLMATGAIVAFFWAAFRLLAKADR